MEKKFKEKLLDAIEAVIGGTDDFGSTPLEFLLKFSISFIIALILVGGMFMLIFMLDQHRPI